MAYKEHNLQTACVRWFRLQYRDLAPLLFAVPNGSRRTRWEAAQAKEEGMVAGVADLLLLVPSSGCHGLCIEMKQETEVWKNGKRTLTRTYQRPEQKAWQAAVEAQGYRYVVCRTFEEFQNTINDYLSR